MPTAPEPHRSKNDLETIRAAQFTAAHEAGHAICAMGLDLNPSCKVIIEMTEPAKRHIMAVHGSHVIFDNPAFKDEHIAMLGYAGKLGALLCHPLFAQASSDELWEKIKTSEPWSQEDLKMTDRVSGDANKRKAFDASVALLKHHGADLIRYYEHCAGDFLADPGDKVTYPISAMPFQTPLKESIRLF